MNRFLLNFLALLLRACLTVSYFTYIQTFARPSNMEQSFHSGKYRLLASTIPSSISTMTTLSRVLCFNTSRKVEPVYMVLLTDRMDID